MFFPKHLKKLRPQAKQNFINLFRRYCMVSPPPKQTTVTVLDACTKVGRILSLLLKQNPLIGELRLYDKDSLVGSLAEDLSHIDTKTQIKSFTGASVLKYAVTVSTNQFASFLLTTSNNYYLNNKEISHIMNIFQPLSILFQPTSIKNLFPEKNLEYLKKNCVKVIRMNIKNVQNIYV